MLPISLDTKRNALWPITLWNKHKFKIAVMCSILFIGVLWWCRDEKQPGAYSKSYSYVPKHISKKVRTDSKGELECRRVLEKLFKRPFSKRRPLFLMNEVSGHKLEIDCCNLDIRLGVEYNGKQHYQYVKCFHKNYETFVLQQYRDHMKNKLCSENNFTLITVPYTTPIEEIESFIVNELNRLGIKY